MKTIYVLLDPRDHFTVYIGRSKDVKRRLTKHLQCPPSMPLVSAWIQELLSLGLRPILRDIMVVPNEDSLKWEHFWIRDYHLRNFKVMNIRGRGYPHSMWTTSVEKPPKMRG